jgi:hypothetical protein
MIERASDMALTRDWYERAALASDDDLSRAELYEAIAECRTRIHRLEKLAETLLRSK